jgi:polysaccharide pyruvyl transferase WcaK-like protein
MGSTTVERVRILTIGDIGPLDHMFHVGDEAMFDELAFQLTARGASVVGLSSNPADSAERYGIDALRPIGFGGLTRDEQEARFAAVLDDPASLPADDPAHAVLAELALCDGVAIAGGGNIASVWPLHIYERAALGILAGRAGIPLVVSGQTIGPVLTAGDRTRVAALLGSAALVGVREPASHALVTSWGVTATQTVDDASFVPDRSGPPVALPPEPYALVTVARHAGDRDPDAYLTSVARLLDAVHAETGLAVVFSAHFGPLGGSLAGASRGDELVHDDLAARMSAPSSVLRIVDTRTSAALARGASLVVSSRYHPAVFAVSGGVPTIGLAVDEYTTVKLSGALGNLGQSSVLSADALDPAAIATVWADRDGIRARGLELANARRAESSAWWDRVAEAFAR